MAELLLWAQKHMNEEDKMSSKRDKEEGVSGIGDRSFENRPRV